MPVANGLRFGRGREEQAKGDREQDKQAEEKGEAGRDSLLFLLSVITARPRVAATGLMGRGGGVWWLLACWQLR